MIDEDIDASLLERRWFATMTAARAKQAECEVLLEVVAIASASWRNSRVELMNLEALRDALGDRMAFRTAAQPSREGGKSQNASRSRRAAST